MEKERVKHIPQSKEEAIGQYKKLILFKIFTIPVVAAAWDLEINSIYSGHLSMQSDIITIAQYLVGAAMVALTSICYDKEEIVKLKKIVQ